MLEDSQTPVKKHTCGHYRRTRDTFFETNPLGIWATHMPTLSPHLCLAVVDAQHHQTWRIELFVGRTPVRWTFWDFLAGLFGKRRLAVNSGFCSRFFCFFA